MAETIEIRPDPAAVRAAEQELGALASHMPEVLRTSINKAVRDTASLVTTILFNEVNVQRNNIRKRITEEKATKTKLFGKVKILNRPIGLINFGARDTRKGKQRGSRKPGSGRGVIARFYRSGAETRLRHAFIATGKSGNRHVWLRDKAFGEKAARSGYSKRFPMSVVQGLSLARVFYDKPEFDRLTQLNIAAKLNQYIPSQVKYVLSKYSPPKE